MSWAHCPLVTAEVGARGGEDGGAEGGFGETLRILVRGLRRDVIRG